MSGTTQRPSALPDTQTAFAKAFTDVHQRIFFSKCAAAGYVPQTVQDAEVMLKTAARLRYEEENVKQAADANSPYLAAAQSLEQVLGPQRGSIKAAEAEHAYAQVAQDFMQDAELYNSVLSLKAAEAEDLRAAFAATA